MPIENEESNHNGIWIEVSTTEHNKVMLQGSNIRQNAARPELSNHPDR